MRRWKIEEKCVLELAYLRRVHLVSMIFVINLFVMEQAMEPH